MHKSTKTKLAGTLALSLGVLLGGCMGGTADDNRSLYSVRQPVVERSNMTMDVASDYDGVPVADQQRLAAWFQSLSLGYGDRISIDDPSGNPGVREDIAAVAGRYGLLLSEGAPATVGFVQPGQVRVVVTRTSASVPGCPDWSANSDVNLANGTSPNYGCATNSNLAAMVANPEDLIAGQQGTGETTVVTSTKAIKAYRAADPTGKDGLPAAQTDEGGK